MHVIPLGRNAQCYHPEVGYKGTLFAGSNCPICEVWLHKSEFPAHDQEGSLHYHMVDEIIVVVGGEMRVGNRKLRPGTALAIDANTHYGLGVGEEGLSFINFRSSEALTVMLEDGTSVGPFTLVQNAPPQVTRCL